MLKFLINFFQRFNAGSIDDRHLLHPYNKDSCITINKLNSLLEFISRSKKQRTSYLYHFNMLWNGLIREQFFLAILFNAQGIDSGKPDHGPHEQKDGEQHTHFYCKCEVKDHGKEKSG